MKRLTLMNHRQMLNLRHPIVRQSLSDRWKGQPTASSGSLAGSAAGEDPTLVSFGEGASGGEEVGSLLFEAVAEESIAEIVSAITFGARSEYGSRCRTWQRGPSRPLWWENAPMQNPGQGQCAACQLPTNTLV